MTQASTPSEVKPLGYSTPLFEDLKGPRLRRVMSYITIAWLFGAFWMHATAGAPLTTFATTLKLSNLEFGYLAAMPFAAALLALPASVLIERSGQRKGIFLVALYLNRLLWIPIGFTPIFIRWFWGIEYNSFAIWSFLALVFLMNAGQCIGSPAWVSWMSEVIPNRVRGRYFTKRRQIGIYTAIPAALLTGWILRTYCEQGQSSFTVLLICATIFSVAGFVGLFDVFLFQFVPHNRIKKPKQSIFKTLFHPLKNKRFVLFSACTSVLWFAVAAQGQFVNKYLIDGLKISSVQIQMMLLVAPLLTQMLILPIWGRAIDRFGKKPAMMTGMLGIIPVGIGWCLMNGGHTWFGYVLSCTGVAFWTGIEVSNFNMVIELSGTDSEGKKGGTAYVALNSAIVNVSGMLGGFFYGYVAESLKDFHHDFGVSWLQPITFYEVLFAISAVLRLLAFMPILWVHEPEARPTFEMMRYMAGNLYNNVAGAVLLPVRMIRRDTGEDESDSINHEK